MAENKELFDVELQPSDFELVQSSQRISDTKIESKPTTFFKDSIKRFSKNKSSIVGAVILGILVLLSIFVPIFSTANISNVNPKESHLAPKLFETGTGFWDGTIKYERIVYDSVNETPAGFDKTAIVEGTLKIDSEPSFIDQANEFGKGGYVMFTHKNDDYGVVKNKYLYTRDMEFKATDNQKVDFTLIDKEDVNNCKLGEYRVYIEYDTGIVNPENEFETLKEQIVLKDWSKDYSEISLDISSAVASKNFSEGKVNGKFVFELKPVEDTFSYILIEKLSFSSDSENEQFAAASFDDATQMVLRPKDIYEVQEGGAELKFANPEYWPCTGGKGLHNSLVYFCKFTYDTYAAAYNEQIQTIAASDFYDQWITPGYCSLDFEVKRELVGYKSKYVLVEDSVKFEVLSDKCKFEGIAALRINEITGKLLDVDVYIDRYILMGYDEMPKFIFGTDDRGYDLFTLCFAGLRTSLILGVCTAVFCFLFGLCWGAISGYFGGNVDLFMERFCDILGGVPWIVVMTLCILHLGNNMGTFLIALCLTGWMGTAARTRTQFYRFKGREYVLASRTLGSSDIRLIFKHILPNSLGTIITSSVFMITSVIFSEASLAYLNLGLQGENSFGVTLSHNQGFITKSPYLVIVPAVIISLMMISFNLFGNGLRDAVNPSLKGSE